ncbi:unnamed protein product [Triticum turgidum subsp. durum]|uniref:Mitochondrial fission protein ELM1 n=1 Tax=Triticum turgidum subsp. durum TaxID=4567 RepID=A0A9R1RNA6_TRITD|nr:unnamed protein product [Triticum turgidum subsp. durum]
MSIRPLLLPEPPGEVDRAPEIFAGGVAAVRRAVVIGNGCAGAENQCLGLVRALGLADRLTLYRIIRPTGGINKWLHFLPISLHKMVDQVLRHILSNTTFTTLFQGKLSAPYPVSNVQSLGLSSVLEADSKRIVTMVRDTFEKEGLAIVVACGRDTIPYASSLHNVSETCGSVRISFSRRTPQNVSDLILREFSTHPKFYIWGGEEPNPHLGHLAWADAFIITADSISMLSEACSTGKPVYVVGTEHCRWKFSDFHNTLQKRGAVRPFTGSEDMSDSWSYPPLNDAIDVAARVREVLAQRGWTVG